MAAAWGDENSSTLMSLIRPGGVDVDDDDDVLGVLPGKARKEVEKEKDNIDGDHLGLFIN